MDQIFGMKWFRIEPFSDPEQSRSCATNANTDLHQKILKKAV